MNQPLLAVNNLTHLYAPDKGFRDVSLELWPGEVLGTDESPNDFGKNH
ncbi:phosphonate C-P lyase system protein PhnK [Klebsiella pneumoniae]|nr:phosphonate C-P lyase system protein PhnK [Klebsiella pneumoniae]